MGDSFIILVGGALFTVGIIVWAGEPTDSQWWVGAAPFALWTLAPYILWSAVCYFARSAVLSRLALIGACLLSGSSTLFLSHAFFISHDAQSGLIVISLPAAQLLAAVLLGLVLLWFRWRSAVA
jgi:hypothetical protein